MTDCLKTWRKIPENNGRYKGIMPKCIECGTAISYVMPGLKQHRHCWKHYDKFMRKSGGYDKRVQKNLADYAWPKGHQPAVPFKKGQIAYNKGKTFEEAFGKRTANKMKKALSASMKARIVSGKINTSNRKKLQTQ